MRLITKTKLWQFRYLFLLLVWRDVKSRYKQAIFGFAWAIFTPTFQALVFWLVFGLVFKVSSPNVPYLALVFSGFTFWNYFAQSVSSATQSVTGNSHLVTKVAFPKEILVIASTISRIPDLLAAMLVLFLILFVFGIFPTSSILWVVPILAIETIFAIALGLFFAALNVYFRDITALVPILMMGWLFLTPAIYPLDSIPVQYQIYAKLNPMTGILEGLRSVILFKNSPEPFSLSISLLLAMLFLFVFYFLFKKLEKGFPDVI